MQSKRVMIDGDPTQSDRDQYGRLLRHVYLTDGRSVALLLSTDGLGKEYTFDKPYAGQADYRAAQAAAKAAARGLWGAHRHRRRRHRPRPGRGYRRRPLRARVPTSSKATSAAAARRSTTRLASGTYDDTRIDLAKGERWFCTAVDAEAAGWRAAKL